MYGSANPHPNLSMHVLLAFVSKSCSHLEVGRPHPHAKGKLMVERKVQILLTVLRANSSLCRWPHKMATKNTEWHKA